MEKYTVNRQWLLGKNSKEYRGGDPVTSVQVANIDELVANGSLIPISEVKTVIDVNPLKVLKDQPIIFTFENEKGETVEARSNEDVSKPEIIALLDKVEPKIDFKKGDKKEVLFDVYLATLKEQSKGKSEGNEPILFTFEGEKSEIIEVKSIKDIDKDQLVVLLGKKLVPFNPADEIEVLFDLYLKSIASTEE
jgi:hypothetical protein